MTCVPVPSPYFLLFLPSPSNDFGKTPPLALMHLLETGSCLRTPVHGSLPNALGWISCDPSLTLECDRVTDHYNTCEDFSVPVLPLCAQHAPRSLITDYRLLLTLKIPCPPLAFDKRRSHSQWHGNTQITLKIPCTPLAFDKRRSHSQWHGNTQITQTSSRLMRMTDCGYPWWKEEEEERYSP